MDYNELVEVKQGDNSIGYHRPGAAITSMVLGICSVSLWWYPFITSIPCFIMGIVAQCIANRELGQVSPKYHAFAKAGKITGIIGWIISLLYTILMTVLIIAAVKESYYW